MANTARTLITNALITAGIIEPTENAEDREIAHGLHELNMLIDSLNTENQWPFTSKRIRTDMVPSQAGLTIGLGNGVKLPNISSDGVVQVYTTKKDHGFQQQDVVEVFDAEVYDLASGIVLEETDRTFTVATQHVPASTDLVASVDFYTDATPTTIAFDSATTYQLGDTIVVTDSNNYSVVGTIDNVINPTLFELTDEDIYQSGNGIALVNGTRYEGGSGFLYADRVVNPAVKNTGIVYAEGDEIPDVREQRPDEVTSVLLTFDTYEERIHFYPVNQWDSRAKQIGSAGRPTAYTYYTTFPFGELRFNPKPDTDYPITIYYKSLICNYELDDEIDLPHGYESAMQYILADTLCANYGIDNPRIERIALERKTALKRNNYKPNVLESDLAEAGQYDIYGDTYL